MKKTFKKIIICLVVIGVVFFTTPFLIKTKADSTSNFYFFGNYNEHLTTSGTATDYEFDVNSYMDYDNNQIKVIFRVLSSDSYIGDYSNFSLYIYQSGNVSQYDEHKLSYIGNPWIVKTHSTNYIELTDGLEMTCIFDCNLSSLFTCRCMYINNENDNDINFSREFYIGYSPSVFENIIEGYKTDYYQKGQTETISNVNPSNYLSQIGTGIGNIFSIELFGGITIGTLIFIPIAMSVLLLLLHVWRRN